jgi:hypothetical protein
VKAYYIELKQNYREGPNQGDFQYEN